MMHGKTPTKTEQAWMTAIVQLGCIVCLLHRSVFTEPCVYHILRGGLRTTHFQTLPLCYGHHQYAPPKSGEIARHQNKARFEEKYGTEEFLLEVTVAAVKQHINPNIEWVAE